METNQKIRAVQSLQIQHQSGDETACEHIVITINGFMSHGVDPLANWETYCRRKKSIPSILHTLL
jgi:hypothetical protein